MVARATSDISRTEVREKSRLLAVGDIHGCLITLQKLLQLIEPRDGDRFVFLGDYIDRGEDSVGVVDFILEFRRRYPSICLRGNHEQMLLDWLDKRDDLWLQYNNGGTITQQAYKNSEYKEIPIHHLRFFRDLPYYWEHKNFIFVHAGLRPCVPLNDQKKDELLWMREPFLSSRYDWGKAVVYGHTRRDKPLVTEKRIALDTGAVRGGKLTCCDVLSGQTWSVSSCSSVC